VQQEVFSALGIERVERRRVMELKFQQHEHLHEDNEELLVTFRRGVKWLGKDSKAVDLVDKDGKVFGKGFIRCTEVFKFCDIPAYLIEMAHNPECRLYSGLKKVMERVYNGFEEEEYITIVMFEIIEIFDNKPQWTDEKPTIDGYYWYKEQKYDWVTKDMNYYHPKIVQVVSAGKTMLAYHMGHRRFTEDMNGKWIGPLEVKDGE
jgi:hypothetical protein